MNTSFFTRASAYIIDAIIVLIILNIITIGVPTNNSYNEKITELTKQLSNGEITTQEYYDQYADVYYDLQKSNTVVNVISIILTIAYFIVFQYLNKGQTIGKKLFNLKIVSTDEKPIKLSQIIIRSIFIYSLISAILNIIFVYIIGKDSYYMVSTITTMIDTLLILITVIFILFRQDKRGIHDVIAKTKVIKEI